jgi:fructose-1-phosphate kinase PfkB-like protein
MQRRNCQLVIVAATIVAIIAAVLVAADIEAADHKCAWQFRKIASCLLSALETLAAGLIGTGGIIFAGWLAYSAAQKSAAQALKEALAAKRAALSEQVLTHCDGNRPTETCCRVS